MTFTVAHVLASPYPPVPGGAERWLLDFVEALRPRLGDLRLVYFGAPAPAGERVCMLRPPRFVPKDHFEIPLGLRKATRDVDIVHVHQYGTVAAQLAGLVGRGRRQRTVVTDLGMGGARIGRRTKIDRIFERFFTISRFAASGLPEDRVRVIYGGVDIDRFHPTGVEKGRYALFVGRFLPHKGIDVLIRALPIGMPLVVAGRPDRARFGHYFDLLQRAAEGRDVTFELNPSDERLRELYSRARVAVLPSVEVDAFGRHWSVPELLGLAPLEAMACGTPVVCSAIASMPELVENGRNGLLVPAGDVSALTAALDRFAEDEAWAARLGRQARDSVAERFTWPRVVDRAMEGYVELLTRQ